MTAKPVRHSSRRWVIAAVTFSPLMLACKRVTTWLSVSVERDLRYGAHPDMVMDVWRGRRWRQPSAPAVIIIHGGGWTGGSRSDMELFCRWFVERGFVVANVEYRTAAAARAPAAILDVRAAASWLQKSGSRWRLDPRRIVLFGPSAGGHLALMAALPRDVAGFGPSIRPAAVISLWGPSDLADLLTARPAAEFRRWLPESDPLAMARRCSPILYVDAAAPPLLAIHNLGDPVVPFDQSKRLTQALREAGAQAAELAVLPGTGHTPVDWDVVFAEVRNFLTRRGIL